MSVPTAYLGIMIICAAGAPAIQWSMQGTGATSAVFARMVVGAALLLWAWRIALPPHARAWRGYLAVGLDTFGAMTLIYWAARHVHSGLACVLP